MKLCSKEQIRSCIKASRMAETRSRPIYLPRIFERKIKKILTKKAVGESNSPTAFSRFTFLTYPLDLRSSVSVKRSCVYKGRHLNELPLTQISGNHCAAVGCGSSHREQACRPERLLPHCPMRNLFGEISIGHHGKCDISRALSDGLRFRGCIKSEAKIAAGVWLCPLL